MSGHRKYRVGIVGVHRRGLTLGHFWRLVEGVELVAVADLAPACLDRARRELGDVTGYADHQDLLQHEELDILTVATAADAHAAVTIDAARRGVPAIFCEKPMGRSLAECDAMIAACQASGTFLAIGHTRRWNPVIRAIRHAIQEGAIGRPTNAYLTWASGRVGTEGTHKWDAISYILDDEAAWVRGILDRTRTSAHEIFGPEMTTDPGPLGVMTFSRGTRLLVDGWNDVMMPYTYLFCGTRGRIELREWARGTDRGHAIEYWARDEDNSDPQYGRWGLPRRDFPYTDPTEIPAPAAIREHYEYATLRGLADMVHCLDTREPPASTGEHGRHALEVVVAFHLSSEQGMRQIALPLTGAIRERRFDLR